MVRINRVYTKTGDGGRTQLIGGAKVAKDNARIECYGTIDELNATLGMFISALESSAAKENLVPRLLRIQNELFNVGTQLATPDQERREKLPDISSRHIEELESEMDELNEELPELRSFVLPGGSPASASAHLARCVCRRAERLVVSLSASEDVDDRHLKYLNRLSDSLFVFARYSMFSDKLEEPLWQPEEV
ncbi:MAG: cob(I)yrinic acid a,c-diamide adenosyltransferase [Kofleriaceae bacterium]|nr:cob(I)yrinic acid a,c-diamide adenosyltransferase [Kofleriaceae bacterium]